MEEGAHTSINGREQAGRQAEPTSCVCCFCFNFLATCKTYYFQDAFCRRSTCSCRWSRNDGMGCTFVVELTESRALFRVRLPYLFFAVHVVARHSGNDILVGHGVCVYEVCSRRMSKHAPKPLLLCSNQETNLACTRENDSFKEIWMKEQCARSTHSQHLSAALGPGPMEYVVFATLDRVSSRDAEQSSTAQTSSKSLTSCNSKQRHQPSSIMILSSKYQQTLSRKQPPLLLSPIFH